MMEQDLERAEERAEHSDAWVMSIVYFLKTLKKEKVKKSNKEIY